MSSMTGGRFLGLWGKTVTVETLMRLDLQAFISACCVAVGSPSLMMMMCLWRGVFFWRPRAPLAPVGAGVGGWAELGVWPGCIRLVAGVGRGAAPLSRRGESHWGPPLPLFPLFC